MSDLDDARDEPLSPERWERIHDLLLAALEIPEEDRTAFLADACGADVPLRTEVESLIEAHASAGPADRLASTLGARLLTELIEGGLEDETVGRYEIRERLGRGGMSIVYRAWDPKLERYVALKCLPGLVSADERSRRGLLAEAQMAAGLEHPNICTIHEIVDEKDGQLFIAMPLYDGQTLASRLESGPLDETEAVRLALDAARGLGKAHDAGIIHRDIKPGNLMITQDGDLKILDFGIAQSEGIADPMGETPGTVHYMSPEQLAGGAIDARSDLWSLGVVLYEMLSGRRPFEGETRQEVREAVLSADIAPLATVAPGVPPALDTLTNALLQRDPSRRPESTAQVVEALRRVGQKPASRPLLTAAAVVILAFGVWAITGLVAVGADAPGRSDTPRIAVLPLVSLTDDPEQDYFAAALTDRLIGQLTQLRDLRVIAYSAVLPYENHPGPLREIAAELGVDAVIEGTVARSGDEVRIWARFVDGATEAHLWERDFTRDFRDLVSLEHEVAAEIAREVEMELSPAEEARLRVSRPVSSEAQAAFLRGVHLQRRYQEDQRSDTTIVRSIEFLTRAVELEPEWAEAHAELARAYHWLASGPSRPERDEYYPKAKASAQRAIELDETVAGGHAALAFVLHMYEWDWAEAEREYRTALELAPNDNYYRWGWAMFEWHTARYDEAVTDFQWALEQAPLSGELHGQLARALACAGRYEEVLAIADQYGPDDPGALQMRGRISLRRGAGQRAIEYFERSVELGDSASMELESLAHAYATLGREREARALLAELEDREWPTPAVYAALGESQRALDQLERAYEQRGQDILTLRCFGRAAFTDLTQLEVLADEPRMAALLRKIDFPE